MITRLPEFQLEMERALLEGEHQMEMEELEREQLKINRLKTRQLELVDEAQAQRDKVRAGVRVRVWRCGEGEEVVEGTGGRGESWGGGGRRRGREGGRGGDGAGDGEEVVWEGGGAGGGVMGRGG